MNVLVGALAFLSALVLTGTAMSLLALQRTRVDWNRRRAEPLLALLPQTWTGNQRNAAWKRPDIRRDRPAAAA